MEDDGGGGWLFLWCFNVTRLSLSHNKTQVPAVEFELSDRSSYYVPVEAIWRPVHGILGRVWGTWERRTVEGARAHSLPLTFVI